MPDVLIHIGYHKTATGWLQRGVFRNPRSGMAWTGKGPDSPVNELVSAHPLDFAADPLAARFGGELKRLADKGLLPVVSLERLSGHPFSGGYDSKEIAIRLAEVFPTGRVLMVIRRQADMIFSTYAQYVKAGGALPLSGFLSPPTYRRPRLPQFDLRHFEYHRLIELYRTLFGDRVLVLPYEQFSTEPRDFVRRIVAFAGAAPSEDFYATLPVQERRNASPGAVHIGLRRRFNRWFCVADVNPYPIWRSQKAEAASTALVLAAERLAPRWFDARQEQRMRQTIGDVIADRYGPSNLRSGELTGLDLASFGYDMSAPAAAFTDAF